MNLRTKYLGFDLPHPVVPGASPLTANLDSIRRLEDAGAPMLVLPSLFEEQIVEEQLASHFAEVFPAETNPEGLTYLPGVNSFENGPEQYLRLVQAASEKTDIPIVASLNGSTAGGWLRYAALIEQAGAAALELNVYDLPVHVEVSSAEIEQQQIEMVRELKHTLHIPLAVKLAPYYTSLPQFACQLHTAGADALVIFNRFYQPDVDPEDLEIVPYVKLSDSNELLLRLRWLAVLSGQVTCDYACAGGVHTELDVLKSVMAGAHVTQVVSCLLKEGPRYIAHLVKETARWLTEHEYESLAQARGSMNLERGPNRRAYARANYMQVLQSWRSE